MLARSSSSWIRRRTAGLSLSVHSAAPADAAFFFAAMPPLVSACLPRPSIPAWRGAQRLRENRLDVVHPGDAQVLAQMLRDVFEVRFVAIGGDHVDDPGALGGERLLLE